ncbi:hypothetical protein K7472_07240 [Streptomyces sp. PTM05]|uniref:Uncharacterized protein n=1 Tax=Streptantibioticus parmotrematis TaxID=2873249 RepID=A0ABS7QS53_9ACTN|nr:hypothetical protein [Streptantibioticus parmotrematis]MBY8884639.1 hypothetical protein [Streptantibioticus parmotrematis]
MPRRVSLPGADELFRTTGGMALSASTPRQHGNGEAASQAAERLRSVPNPAAGDDDAVPGPDGAAHDAEPDEAGADAGDGRERAARQADAAHQSGAAEHTRTAVDDARGATAPAQRRAPQDQGGSQRRRGGQGSPARRPSGRERHDEKITVYVSAEELMDLEHARLVLRGEHGLAVDRGRIVREAVAVVLADLESRGDASILVRRLRGR